MADDTQQTSDGDEKVKLEVEVPKKQFEQAGTIRSPKYAGTADHKPSDNDTQEENLHDKGKMTVAGYTVGDIAGSVTRPPHPEDEPQPVQERPAKTRPSIVSQVLIIIGIGLIVLGALFLLVDTGITLVLCLFGALSAMGGLAISKFARE